MRSPGKSNRVSPVELTRAPSVKERRSQIPTTGARAPKFVSAPLLFPAAAEGNASTEKAFPTAKSMKRARRWSNLTGTSAPEKYPYGYRCNPFLPSPHTCAEPCETLPTVPETLPSPPTTRFQRVRRDPTHTMRRVTRLETTLSQTCLLTRFASTPLHLTLSTHTHTHTYTGCSSSP